jgi:hypothetical protein
MPVRTMIHLLAALLLTIATSPGTSNNRHLSEIRRAQPTAFRKLPRSIAAYLIRRGCTIPQTYLITPAPENVIRGQFMGPGTHDWAILCSRRGTSAILVFAGGSARPAAELATRRDRDFLQIIGSSGQLGFSRLIAPISKRELARADAKGDLHIDHDGIEDSFLEKASVVHFRTVRGWRELPRAD